VAFGSHGTALVVLRNMFVIPSEARNLLFFGFRAQFKRDSVTMDFRQGTTLVVP
jgi:hypothetical protein